MDYERLQKLVAYVLKAVVIYNYGDSAQLLEKVEDTEFEWLSTAPFPRPLTVAQALVGLALEMISTMTWVWCEWAMSE